MVGNDLDPTPSRVRPCGPSLGLGLAGDGSPGTQRKKAGGSPERGSRGPGTGWPAHLGPAVPANRGSRPPREVRVGASSPWAGLPTSTPRARAPNAPCRPSPTPESELTGPASQRPSGSSRVPDPSLQRPFSTPAPHSQVGSQSSQVFATSVLLAGAGDRARCYLPPPPVRALRATPPTPRDFQGLPFPNPRQMEGPLSSGQGSVGDVRTKTLNFSFSPP